ncbi:MAG: N-acetylneuraminic acid mutarotase, partial [Phycisphaerales bacterium]|nr:N-acetylneuraminic acid mutarotase [Phycisphaerales bacterium]
APAGFAEGKSVAVNGKLYVFGGYYKTTPDYQATTAAESYDPTTNTWTGLADMPVAETHMGVASDGTYIYVAGGYTYDPKTTYQTFGTTNVWRYDIAHNSWSAFTPLPAARGAGAMVILNNQLHYFDGLQGQTTHTDHWALDLAGANPQWVISTPTPLPRNHLMAAVLDGKIYALGGNSSPSDTSTPTAEALVWDPANPSAWTPIASLPQIRSRAAVMVIDGRIVIAGGAVTPSVPVATVVAYDPTTNSWSTLTSLPAARLTPTGAAIGNEMIVVGGSLDNIVRFSAYGALIT